MVKVITDGKAFLVDSVEDLEDHLEELFPEDANADVVVTYVISRQPQSRRVVPA